MSKILTHSPQDADVGSVTGGGTGLGLITAVTFLVNGAARVCKTFINSFASLRTSKQISIDITGRRGEVLRKAAETYNQAEGAVGEIIPLEGDVTKKEDIESNIFLDFHGFTLLQAADSGVSTNRACRKYPGQG